MTEEFDLQFKQEFASEYLRNNKNSQCKNLRCFPQCSVLHVDQGFCGCSIVVEVSVSNKSKYQLEELTLVGEFQPIDETFDGIQGCISESKLRNYSVKPHNLYSIAQVETTKSTETSTLGLGIFTMKPWKYGWKGNRSRLPTFHSFVVSILAPNTGFGLRVLKQFFSPVFLVSSVRRASPRVASQRLMPFLPEPRVYQSLFPRMESSQDILMTSESCVTDCTTVEDLTTTATSVVAGTTTDEDIHQMTVDLEGLCSDYSEEEEVEQDGEGYVAPIEIIRQHQQFPPSLLSTPPSTPRPAATASTAATAATAASRSPQTPLTMTPRASASSTVKPTAVVVVTPDLASQKYDSVARVRRPSFLAMKLKSDRKRTHHSHRVDSPFTEECGRIVTQSSVSDSNDEQDIEGQEVSVPHHIEHREGTADADDDDSFIKLPFKLQRSSSISTEDYSVSVSVNSNSIRSRVSASLSTVRECIMTSEQRRQHHIRLIDQLFAKQT